MVDVQHHAVRRKKYDVLKFKTDVLLKGATTHTIVQVEISAIVGGDYEIEETNVESILDLRSGEFLELDDIEDEKEFDDKIYEFVASNAGHFYEAQLGTDVDDAYDRYVDMISDLEEN